VMMRRRVMVVRMVMMRLVMVMMRRIAIATSTAVGRVASAGAYWRRSGAVMVQIHQSRWWLRDGGAPYRSWRVTSTACTIKKK
jgi:hypothetical protein